MYNNFWIISSLISVRQIKSYNVENKEQKAGEKNRMCNQQELRIEFDLILFHFEMSQYQKILIDKKHY